MKFLIDNALSPSVALGLGSEGHDVLHVRHIDFQRASDGVIIQRAPEEDRILVSADTDFGSLLLCEAGQTFLYPPTAIKQTSFVSGPYDSDSSSSAAGISSQRVCGSI